MEEKELVKLFENVCVCMFVCLYVCVCVLEKSGRMLKRERERK
jgi:hypothetical protein